MARYRKKPVEIEAFRIGYDNLPDWFMDHVSDNSVILMKAVETAPDAPFSTAANIRTLEGTMYADNGDWIIKGVKGELYPCKPDIFEETYAPVETPNAPTD